MRQIVRTLVIATAMATAIALMPDVAGAQRGGGRGGGGGGGGSRGGGGGGGAVRSGGSARSGAPVGHAVPRGGGGGPTHGGGYPGGYRGGYYGGYRGAHVGGPVYWGGVGLGFGWGYGWGYAGWGAWGPGWWGPGYASSLWWPGYGWWAGPALYAPPYGGWGITSDARFLVKPRNAEVYVDGALAGIVDQYDGTFQSLTLAPGTHQISLYLEGHRRHDTNVYVAPGSTLKLRHTMEPLAAGDTPDERPVLAPRPQSALAVEDDSNGAPAAPIAPRANRGESRSPRAIVGEAGVLVIRVQPADAEILIDGQRWETPDATSHPLEVRVPAGRVRVEVRKPGYTPFSTEVTVQPGEITPLNVSLPSLGQPL